MESNKNISFQISRGLKFKIYKILLLSFSGFALVRLRRLVQLHFPNVNHKHADVCIQIKDYRDRICYFFAFAASLYYEKEFCNISLKWYAHLRLSAQFTIFR